MVQGIGLGPIQLYSYLNDNLDAEIELLASENFELDSLLVNLASTEDFQRAGVERSSILSHLKFTPVRVGKKTFVKISSQEVIKDPYVDFLLELTWPGGRLIRAYTLLIDPTPLEGKKKSIKRLSEAGAKEANLHTSKTEIMQLQKMTPASTTPQTPLTKSDITQDTEGSKQIIATQAASNNTAHDAATINSAPNKAPEHSNKTKSIDENLRQLFEPEIQVDHLPEKKSPIHVNTSSIIPVPIVKSSHVIEGKAAAPPLHSPIIPVAESTSFPERLINSDSTIYYWGLLSLVFFALLGIGCGVVYIFKRRATIIQFVQSNETAIPNVVAENTSDNIFATTPESANVLANELALKLELAKGYIDIGDKEQATEVLQNIINEPYVNDEQRDAAQHMLDEMNI